MCPLGERQLETECGYWKYPPRGEECDEPLDLSIRTTRPQSTLLVPCYDPHTWLDSAELYTEPISVEVYEIVDTSSGPACDMGTEYSTTPIKQTWSGNITSNDIDMENTKYVAYQSETTSPYKACSPEEMDTEVFPLNLQRRVSTNEENDFVQHCDTIESEVDPDHIEARITDDEQTSITQTPSLTESYTEDPITDHIHFDVDYDDHPCQSPPVLHDGTSTRGIADLSDAERATPCTSNQITDVPVVSNVPSFKYMSTDNRNMNIGGCTVKKTQRKNGKENTTTSADRYLRIRMKRQMKHGKVTYVCL